MKTVSSELDSVIHEIACVDLGKGQPVFESNPAMSRFKNSGTELWLDTGDLEKAQSIWKSEFTALSTNNTLANQVTMPVSIELHHAIADAIDIARYQEKFTEIMKNLSV